MKGPYPDHATYHKLYARYLVHRPANKLVDLAGELKNKTVLDLCGGEGEIALLAKKRGADIVILIDGQHSMFHGEKLEKAGIYPLACHLPCNLTKRLRECWDAYEPEEWRTEDCHCPKCHTGFDKADVVFCRQAVNYWMYTEWAVERLVAVMHIGGKFIFNTFNTKPSEEPTVKKYQMGTGDAKTWHNYVEVHWLIGDDVHHVQIREGMEPHHTVFKWIPPERFNELLYPHFDIEEKVDGATTIYICTKRSK